MLVPTPAQVRRAVKLAGGLPVLVKLLRGSQGTGMVLCRSIAEAEAAVATIHALGWDVMVQKYITESWGEDVRLLVAGGELVAAMKRKARGDEFRSNIHRGGKALPFSPDREMIRIGIKATRLLGLDIAGVDLLLSRQGPLVLEVNPTPGFEGLQNVSSVNIAQQLAQFILSGTGCRRSRQQA
jgi:ribosomal protein S6--L-glutamate ligase